MDSIRLAEATDVEALGARIAAVLEPGDVVLLEGGLGAGKTTLTRGMLRGLGLIGEAPSPTYAILQGYGPPELRLPVGHADLYRLENAAELDELGLDDWLADGALIVEWPALLGRAYDPFALKLRLDVEESGARLLTAMVGPAWEGRWPLP